MRLLEAIIYANHRAVAGDPDAALHPAEFADSLPLVVLTCFEPRLNALFPNVLGLPKEQFIWLRNAGNIITGSMSSTVRSLALACAIKHGDEIASIGPTDCQVGRTTTLQLLDRLRELGVARQVLPENVNEFFGVFGSERQNVIKACDFVRRRPIISAKIAVHGLLVDVATDKLEWLVNDYQILGALDSRMEAFVQSAGQSVDGLTALTDFNIGEMKFSETKIGETVVKPEDRLAHKVEQVGAAVVEAAHAHPGVANVAQQVAEYAEKHWLQPPEMPSPRPPKKIPLPPSLRPKLVRKDWKILK